MVSVRHSNIYAPPTLTLAYPECGWREACLLMNGWCWGCVRFDIECVSGNVCGLPVVNEIFFQNGHLWGSGVLGVSWPRLRTIAATTLQQTGSWLDILYLVHVRVFTHVLCLVLRYVAASGCSSTTGVCQAKIQRFLTQAATCVMEDKVIKVIRLIFGNWDPISDPTSWLTALKKLPSCRSAAGAASSVDGLESGLPCLCLPHWRYQD